MYVDGSTYISIRSDPELVAFNDNDEVVWRGFQSKHFLDTFVFALFTLEIFYLFNPKVVLSAKGRNNSVIY